MNKVILIVGGAGYIGSHMVEFYREQGISAVVLDNLSNGHRDALPDDVPFYQGDLADAELVGRILLQHNINVVMHFAAFIEVGESVIDPAKYYHNNLVKTITLLDTLRTHGVNHFIFSSTAAVYGEPQYTPIDEQHPKAPINPYGASKWALEQVLQSYSRAYGLNYVALRYFNAAGAHPAGHLSERHEPETHVIPLLLEVAMGKREQFYLFGEDYDTSDGSCVRDFIHVMDLCGAHDAALNYLLANGVSRAFNVGTGQGFSVKSVVDKARSVTGCDIAVEHKPRRLGDPAILTADASALGRVCGWRPEYSELELIIRHAWLSKQQGVEAL